MIRFKPTWTDPPAGIPMLTDTEGAARSAFPVVALKGQRDGSESAAATILGFSRVAMTFDVEAIAKALQPANRLRDLPFVTTR